MKSPSEILQAFREGSLNEEETLRLLHESSTPDLGHTRLDLGRQARTGSSEVIYGNGKTPEQIVEIASALISYGQNVLATRLSDAAAEALLRKFPKASHSPIARLATITHSPQEKKQGSHIAVVSAGTSDQPVAEEAALTAEFMGSQVKRYYDCGVAGLHRILNVLDDIRTARVIIAVAGMEGALPSVIAGLVKAPVIAVPTSVGYGANMQGIATLLAMLNSCANGITVVNIDNGFGAGYNAHVINCL